MNKQLKGQINIETALKQSEIIALKNRIELCQIDYYKKFKQNMDRQYVDIICEYASNLNNKIEEIFEKTIDNLLKKL